MSQVVVTHDSLSQKRIKSRDQEHKITVDAAFSRFLRTDITGSDPIAKLAGLAVMPILALWGLLVGVMTLMVTIVNYLFKGLGRVIGGTKSLIRS